MLGLNLERVKNYAISIELIHSYSLVHDDLPAMDNDDYRRGKLSTHKKFGEAMGILIGDALLNMSFDFLLKDEDCSLNALKASKKISELAGILGMIGGQVLDVDSTNLPIEENTLYDIYEKKTAGLIVASLVAPSLLAGGKYYTELYEIGKNVGFLFQITDDILDIESDLPVLGKKIGKDEEAGKITAINVFGIKKAKERAEYHYNIAKNLLLKIPSSDFLLFLLDKIYKRNK